MHTKAYIRTLQAWAKEWVAENLDDTTNALISAANFDLYHGPVECSDDDNWPGFMTACARISKALDSLPCVLYVDTDCEGWQSCEPELASCRSCDGSGMSDHDVGKCRDCNGSGSIFDICDDWCEVERQELKDAVVGKELGSYV